MFDYSKQRMDTCKSCEHYQPEPQKCGKCGCFMPAKVLVPFVKCPEDKWKSVNDNRNE